MPPKIQVLIKCLPSLFLIMMVFACNNPHKKVNSTRNNSTAGIKVKSNKNDSVNAVLPFGSSILADYKFPEIWEYPLDEDSEKPNNPIQKKFYQLRKFYEKIEYSKATESLPTIKTIEWISNDEDSSLIKHNKIKVDSFIYRLPQIGPYNCYFQNSGSIMERIKLDNQSIFCPIGILILYNPQTQQAKVLVIHLDYTYEDSFADFYRFYYITKSKKIQIFEGMQGESTGKMKKTQEATISNDGKISIEKFK